MGWFDKIFQIQPESSPNSEALLANVKFTGEVNKQKKNLNKQTKQNKKQNKTKQKNPSSILI